LELIIVTSIGPRILSLSLNNGENLLYEDGTNFSVNEWRLYGGHRFTTAPECDVSYAPDNDRCEVDVAADRLLVRTSILGLGLQKTLEIAPDRNHNAFEIRHYLTNDGTSLWRGAAWAITCVPPVGQVFLPWFASTDLRSSQPRFWAGFNNDYANPEHTQWKTNEKAFQIEPSGFKGKMGLFSERAQIIHLRRGTALVIQSTDEQKPGSYPDGNCNIEVFTCRDYLELETLGPATLLRRLG
jgi:hypothetical protein